MAYMNGKRTNCPNCGAPIEYYYNYKCKYCGTYLHNTDEELKKINNCDYRIDDVYIERNPLRMSFILTIVGYTTPKMHYFEEGIDDSYIISGKEIFKKVGYKIEIPIDLIYERDDRKFIDYILNSIPSELCNGYNENKILSKCYEFLQKHF